MIIQAFEPHELQTQSCNTLTVIRHSLDRWYYKPSKHECLTKSWNLLEIRECRQIIIAALEPHECLTESWNTLTEIRYSVDRWW